jgi:hypothetical protein
LGAAAGSAAAAEAATAATAMAKATYLMVQLPIAALELGAGVKSIY